MFLSLLGLTTVLYPRKCTTVLQCSSSMMLMPRSCLKLKGDCAFSIAAPRLWNELPAYVRLSPDIGSFKYQFKTYLFFISFSIFCHHMICFVLFYWIPTDVFFLYFFLFSISSISYFILLEFVSVKLFYHKAL